MVKKVIVHTMLLLLALFCILPFCMVVAVSFSAEKDVAMFGYSLIPHTFSTEAYQYLFQQSGQLSAFLRGNDIRQPCRNTGRYVCNGRFGISAVKEQFYF